MEYSTEQITQVQEYAKIYLPIREMAVLMDIPSVVLHSDIADKSSDISKAYHKGKAESKVMLLKQEMELAQIGSPLAIENAHRNLLDMEDDE